MPAGCRELSDLLASYRETVAMLRERACELGSVAGSVDMDTFSRVWMACESARLARGIVREEIRTHIESHGCFPQRQVARL